MFLPSFATHFHLSNRAKLLVEWGGQILIEALLEESFKGLGQIQHLNVFYKQISQCVFLDTYLKFLDTVTEILGSVKNFRYSIRDFGENFSILHEFSTFSVQY